MSSDPGGSTVVLPLRVWLALSHLMVLLLPLVVLVFSGTLGSDLRKQTRWDLEHQGALIAMLVESEIRQARWIDDGIGIECCLSTLSSELRRAKEATLSGIQITDATGLVVATSGKVLGEDLSRDAEVLSALKGQRGHVVRPRPPPTDPQPLSSQSRRARVRLFVAVPVILDGEVLGTIVLSRTPREELQALYQMAPRAALAVAGALLVTLAMAWGAGILATRSLMSLDRGARRIATGDFGGLVELRRPQESHVAEVSRVAGSVTNMAVRLRERLGYIGEFASNVSHEFKTPLATLRGTVELLADEPDMEAPQRDRFLSNAERELDRLERLVSGLLSLARAEEADVGEPVDLQGILERSGAAREVVVEGEARPVAGESDQIEAVVLNLIDNARRHGGSGATVCVAAWHDDTRSGFDVVDDGVGISEANLPQVFDRFFTTDRGSGGTGLGLALVRAVCRRMGGDVTVQSVPGRTAFRVSLPRPISPSDRPS